MPSNFPEPEADTEIGESLELPLLKLLLSTAQLTGHELLDVIPSKLIETCQVSYACVSELRLGIDTAHVIAWQHGQQRLEPYDYMLKGTPCSEVVDHGTTVFVDSVAQKFPTDAWLSENGAEGYAAVQLRSISGDTIGLLTVVHDAPLYHAEFIVSILEAIAPRVAAELERYQRERILARSEAGLRILVEFCRDILFYIQMPNRRFEFLSPAVEDVTGYPPEAFIANPQLAIDIVDEADRPNVLHAIDSGSDEPILCQIKTAQGETRWVEYRNHAFHDDEGKITAICGTIRDTTLRTQALQALKVSENYRSALLATIPDTLFRLDSNGNVLDYVSGEATRAFGNTGLDIKGRNLRDLLPATFVTPVMQVTRSALAARKLQQIEFEVNGGSQSMIFEARGLPFDDREVIVILRDFTAIKWHEGEEERRRFRDELDVKVEQRRSNPYMLTYRELAILHLVAEGQADKQIAESLGISTYTVNKHVGNILGKMNAASRTEAGVRAIREGLVG